MEILILYVVVQLLAILGTCLGFFLVVDRPEVLSKAPRQHLCHVSTPAVLSKVMTISLSPSEMTTLSLSLSESGPCPRPCPCLFLPVSAFSTYLATADSNAFSLATAKGKSADDP